MLQINPEKAREEFRTAAQKSGGTGVKDFMDGMGLGMIAEQVKLFQKRLELLEGYCSNFQITVCTV